MTDELRFKFATDPDEFDQIRALNYRTFVQEIPQHAPNPEGRLRDRFEEESAFCICLRGRKLVGMLALRSQRPFSLDLKLPNLDELLPPCHSPCEIRLLAVEPGERHGRILLGLGIMVTRYMQERGHDIALISGTLRQSKLYAHLGFVPFGPLVGTPEAPFQPMYQYVDSFLRRAAQAPAAVFNALVKRDVNLLPGPVYLSPAVKNALSAKPASHRSETFLQLLDQTRRRLGKLVNAPHVSIALGSGTLANDFVAGQLAQVPGPGLVLVNGEFGRRLADHAARIGLDFATHEIPYGQPFEESAVRAALEQGTARQWLWAVHAETSTGVLNDMALFKRLARDYGLFLALDCVSSIGVVPVDLDGVNLASGVSGKGLLSIAGLALVFDNGQLPPPRRTLPRYLDLRLFEGRTVPFTIPSNLVAALNIALEHLRPEERYRTVRETAEWLCQELRRIGLPPLADPSIQFPGAITIPIPDSVSSAKLGEVLESDGWLLSYQSGYLRERNWIQICLLGSKAERHELEPLLRALKQYLSEHTSPRRSLPRRRPSPATA